MGSAYDKALLGRLLDDAFGAAAVRRDEPMSSHTTFKVGGPVDFLVEPNSIEGVRSALEAASRAFAPVRLLGCGSNVLVADKGLAGLVVKLGERFSAIEVDGATVRAQAGATNRQVSDAARDAGLSGYEFASGIPGSIGGAAIMNAGAYDGEFCDVCTSVTCLSPAGEVVEVGREQAGWGYRTSMMQREGWTVLGAVLELRPGSADDIGARVAELDEKRGSKQPLEMASAGSTFKRPEGHFAGKLIDDAGMRGHAAGGAQVSTKHAGFVVNRGGATAADILQVISDVQKAVEATSGVRLEPEVRMWGFD